MSPNRDSEVALGLQLAIGTTEAEVLLDYFAGTGTSGHAVISRNRDDGTDRRFILIEQADHFDTVLLPRLKKVTYTPAWKDGKPNRLATPHEADRSPRIMNVIRLESYEDALNNLELRRTEQQQELLGLAPAQGPDKLREQSILRYMLDVETRGSQSLLNVDAFIDPAAYKLKVKRDDDEDLPEDAPRRLLLEERLEEEPNGRWWFRTATGTTPVGRRALVIWRKRPGGESPDGVEQDNLVLDEWFATNAKDGEVDLIYVNGGNNLENLKAPGDKWKVRLIEEDFHRLMFETDGR